MHRGSHRSLCDGGESELNMLNRTKIGFDRTIRSEWLDAAAARIANGDSADATRKFLWDFLEDVERGNTNNSGRGKTLTVLTRIWISVPEKAGTLKKAALRQIASARVEQRIAIQWAMTAGTHPFFGSSHKCVHDSAQAGRPRRGKRLRMCSCRLTSAEVVCRSVDGRLRGPRFWWGTCSAAAGLPARY